MRTFIKTLGLISVLAFALVPGSGQVARADDNDNGVSFQTFYDQLASQGTWIQTSEYGYVFQPAVSDPNWQPYTYGHWVDADQGMMWVSDEPFGWATYHYGRWVNLDGYGWVWVPGYTWAPAWVSWREGDDYCGWAPLPPDAAVGIDFFDPWFWFGFGFHIGDDCDLAFGIGPAWYNFCPVAYIGDPYCWRHFADRRDNFAIINRTRNITNINVANSSQAGRFGRVHEDGPSLAAINARSMTPVRQVHLTSASTLAANDRLRGNSLSVFAPNIDPATMKTARPQFVGRTLTTTSVNRGSDINRPLVVTSGITSPGPTAGQIHAATLAQRNAPADAKIAAANTQPSRPLTQPLTSLSPNTVRESRSMSEPVTRHTSSVSHESSFSSFFHSFNQGGSSYPPSSVVHQSSAPVFHSSVSVYHPQPSFHSFSPAPHFSGGAPAPHIYSGGVSSGGGGGQVRSGNGDRQRR